MRDPLRSYLQRICCLAGLGLEAVAEREADA